MTATVAGIHLGLDTHANRPAANTVPDGSIYSCSTHGLFYKSNYAGNSWSTYATLGAAASGSITASGYTQNTARLLGRTTGSAGAIEEITVGSGLSLAAGALTATGGSGTTFGQPIAYPSSFTGDNDDMAATTNWADVSAFNVKEILNSTILHVQTVGASKDNKVRFTLGTTKAAAFDFRWWGVLFNGLHWSASEDTYLQLDLKTSADGPIAGFRIAANSATGHPRTIYPVVAGSKITTNIQPTVPVGEPVSLRITRDGSNVLGFFIGTGNGYAPIATFVQQSDDAPYAPTGSGTIARSEMLIHTPSGPGGTAQWDAYVDVFQSV